MIEKCPLSDSQGPRWQLLAELLSPDSSGNEQKLAEPVAGMVQELGLESAQVERIQKAVVEAQRKATGRGKQDPHNSPILMRLWTWGVSTEGPNWSTTDAQRPGRHKRRGWGFFLIEKQEGDPQAEVVEARRVIELFLYQESRLAE